MSKMGYYETEHGTPVAIPDDVWCPCTYKPISKEEYDRLTSHQRPEDEDQELAEL